VLKKFFTSINPFKKGGKLYSIIKLKCPRCQEGNMFITRNPYNLKKFDKMLHNCPVCGQDFEQESGFYWGAMMVSHATTMVLAVIIHSIIFYFFGWETAPHIISLLTIFIVLVPVIFRNSRAIWINIFVNYDSTYYKNHK
jgi:uncharacterized protein (DUF983 family)